MTLSMRIGEGVEAGDKFTTEDGRTLAVSDYTDKTQLSGTHRLEGVIMLSGPAVRAGCTIERASIVDVTPTLLYFMGSPVGADMDGRVLTECMRSDFLEDHPVVTVESRDGEVSLRRGAGEEEMPDAVRRRLRELGYIK